MEENNNQYENNEAGSNAESATESGGYTGEYGNAVEGEIKPDTTYSYSYKNGDNSATHSGDYYRDENPNYQSSSDSSSEYSGSSNAQNTYSSTDYQQKSSYGGYNQNYNPNYNGGQGNSYNQNNNQGYGQGNGNGKKPKKTSPVFSKILVCAACAVIFGVVAGVCFEGVRYVAQNIFGVTETSSSSDKKIGSTTGYSKAATGGPVNVVTDVSGIVEQTMPSVVAITSTTVTTNYYNLFGDSQEQEATSCGTGFIVGQSETELLIATNNHVIDGAKTISVQFIDDEVYKATVKGKDSSNDLAVVAVEVSDVKSSTMDAIKIADVGNSDELKVGEMAIAIGNSLGYGQSVTVGYISAKDREITETSETDGSTNTIEAIQTDAAINPGNSGGPLINLQGQVVGINSAKISDSSVEGVGYAIPVSVATPIIDELMKKESLTDSEKGYLGISGRTVSDDVAAYNIPSGVYVAEVSKGGAADKAGIKVGDIITSVNNQSVTTIESLQEKVNSYRKGTEVEIVLQRSNNGVYEEQKVTAKLQGSSSLDGLSSDNEDNSNQENNDSQNDGENEYNQDDYYSDDDGGFFGDFFSNPFGY